MDISGLSFKDFCFVVMVCTVALYVAYEAYNDRK